MLFKKILSFTITAAVSSAMLMSAPASERSSVNLADSDPSAFLRSAYAAEADGTDTEDNAVIGQCCACGKDLTKENFHIAASGAQSCFDCYPITVNCLPKSTRTVTDTVKKIELNDRDTGTIVFEHEGTYDLGMSDNFTRLNNKLGHVLREGETIELCYYYEDVPEEVYYRDTPSIYNIVAFKSVKTIAAPEENAEEDNNDISNVFDVAANAPETVTTTTTAPKITTTTTTTGYWEKYSLYVSSYPKKQNIS